jgi:peptidoglycan/LPS O-acetylase OafA/YrhL
MNASTEQRLQGAEGLRGFACLIVLVVHTIAISFVNTMPYLAGCAKIGVWLFFVLSAFLLTYQFERRGFGFAALIDYFVGRFLRIIPAFTVAVLFYHFCGTADIDGWDDVKSALLFEKGFAHLWTIPVEFKAYAIIPIFAMVFLALRLRAGAKGVVSALLLTLIIHQWFFPYQDLKENSIDTVWYLGSFLIGSASAALLPLWRRLGTRWTELIAWIAIAIIVVVTPAFDSFAFGWPPSPVLANKGTFLSLVLATFLLSVLSTDNHWRRIFSSRIFTGLGNCSYSIYLVHWYFVATTSSWQNHYLGAFFSFVASIFAGTILYLAMEKPAEKTRKLLRSWLTAKGHGSAPYEGAYPRSLLSAARSPSDNGVR